MIKNNEISVVFQGPLFFREGISLTNQCLETARAILPGAEIVLSTWRGENIAAIDSKNYDILILNQDPGALDMSTVIPNASPNNVNRQIVSARNGIKATTQRYVLKLRTDIVLTHAGFKEYYGKFQERCSTFNVLEERVLALAFGSVNPRRCIGCYWFCDWVQFGLRSDLLNIWDIPLASITDLDALDTTLEGRYYAELLLINEMYVWTSFLRKNVQFRYLHTKDCSEYAICNTEMSFANNLVLLELEQFGVESLKNYKRKDSWQKFNVLFWVMCYSHREWMGLYKKYCDPLIDIPDDPERLLKKSALEDYFSFLRTYGAPINQEYVDHLKQLGVSDAMLPFDTVIMATYVRLINQRAMDNNSSFI